MTCIELQESLAENENGSSDAQKAHLRDCPHCAALVAELLVIACAAGELRGANEPSPRVWNSIEIALRNEGVIRPQHLRHSFFPGFGTARSWRWLLPLAAILLLAVGILVRQHMPSRPMADNQYSGDAASAALQSDATLAGLNDDDLIYEIAQQSPALQAQYTENLRRVNQYILDAKSSLASDPNDEEAHRSLMDAYQQKAMLFELAMDRSLP
jgi:hypothetical protein